MRLRLAGVLPLAALGSLASPAPPSTPLPPATPNPLTQNPEDYARQVENEKMMYRLEAVSRGLVEPEKTPEQIREEAYQPLGALVETIDGADSLIVTSADRKRKRVRRGAVLDPGDRFEVPAGAAVRLEFEEGTEALVAGGSDVKVDRERVAPGFPTVPALELGRGEVRALVPPRGEDDPTENGEPAPVPTTPSGKPRVKFLIRSRAAVMGVRGTDFVARAEGESASVHTLSGAVELGQTLDQIHRDEAVPVPARFFADTAGPGKGLNRARSFEPGAFLSELHGRHPRLEPLWRAAVQDRKSGAGRDRFREIRRKRYEKLRQGRPEGAPGVPSMKDGRKRLGPPPAGDDGASRRRRRPRLPGGR